jgi:Tfp pilus assembly protein PilE
MIKLAARSRLDSAFTLVEAMTIALILGILAAISFPIYLSQVQNGYISNLKVDVSQTVISLSDSYNKNGEWPASNAEFNNYVLVKQSDKESFKAYTYSYAVGQGGGVTVDANAQDAPITTIACVEGTNTTQINDNARKTWSYIFSTVSGGVSSGKGIGSDDAKSADLRQGPCPTSSYSIDYSGPTTPGQNVITYTQDATAGNASGSNANPNYSSN